MCKFITQPFLSVVWKMFPLCAQGDMNKTVCTAELFCKRKFFKRQQSKRPSTGGYLKLAIYLYKGVERSRGTQHAAANKEETDSA